MKHPNKFIQWLSSISGDLKLLDISAMIVGMFLTNVISIPPVILFGGLLTIGGILKLPSMITKPLQKNKKAPHPPSVFLNQFWQVGLVIPAIGLALVTHLVTGGSLGTFFTASTANTLQNVVDNIAVLGLSGLYTASSLINVNITINLKNILKSHISKKYQVSPKAVKINDITYTPATGEIQTTIKVNKKIIGPQTYVIKGEQVIPHKITPSPIETKEAPSNGLVNQAFLKKTLDITHAIHKSPVVKSKDNTII